MISETTRCKKIKRRQQSARLRTRCLSESEVRQTGRASGPDPGAARGITVRPGCGGVRDTKQQLGPSHRLVHEIGGAE